MSSALREYENILTPRKEELSNFMWASRTLTPQFAYIQPVKPSPQFHKDEVVKSKKIQELLDILSEQQNSSKNQLENQIRNILDEIGYNRKIKLIRWLGLVLVKICNKILSGIYVNQSYLSHVKSLMGNCPVVFVPSHRSYADFILMSFMCFSQDIAIPAIAAGMDFHGMWGMGTMLRDTGAFFMRRSYNDDSIYWATFKQYVYQIVTKGELPIEFFIEGTRSRSGKSVSPKYGLILMILKAFFLSAVPDIIFIPINISYDRVLEETLFAYELIGIPKPKESTSGFFKSLKIVKEKFGNIYMHFAEPISAKEFFSHNLDRSSHNLGPIHQQELNEIEKKLVPAFAHKIVSSQQKHCIITTFNLIAILLDNNLTHGTNLFTIKDIIEDIAWLKQILEEYGAFVDIRDLEKDVSEALAVHHNIVTIDSNNKITLKWNKVVLDKFDPGKLKAHALSEDTISFSVPFVMLQLYINPALHYLVDASILIIILKYYQHSAQKDELFGHYHFLRSLLSQEFVTFSPWEKMEFEKALENSIRLNLIHLKSTGFYELGENKKLEQVICTSLDCFIYTYFVVCCVLQEVPNICEEKNILAKVQSQIEIGINDNTAFIHPYSLSLDSISNCLNVLTYKEVIKKTKRGSANCYEINKNEVTFIKNKLEHCIPTSQMLQRKLESVQLHLNNKL